MKTKRILNYLYCTLISLGEIVSAYSIFAAEAPASVAETATNASPPTAKAR